MPLSFFDRVTKPEFPFKEHTEKQYFPRREILQLIDFMARKRERGGGEEREKEREKKIRERERKGERERVRYAGRGDVK